MVRSSSCKYSLLFLLSLMQPLVADEAKQEEAMQPSGQIEIAQILANHLKNLLTAGLIKTCEKHKMPVLDSTIYAIEDDATFTSKTSNNGNGLPARIARIIGTQPTLTITASTMIKENTYPTAFQNAMIIFANDPTFKCTKKTDASGNTITCSILLTMQEFHKLKEMYQTTP